LANFNPQDYETVEERIKRFYADHSDGRIITENLTSTIDRQAATWVVKTAVYFTGEELLRGTPKATGLAFEVDGVGMANKTSALENAETSSIGRALANAGYSGNKRATREEMAKVARDVTPEPAIDWIKAADDLAWQGKKKELIDLYNKARRMNAPADIVAKIKDIGSGLSAKENPAK
jgi:hypothetical protein